MAIKLRKRKPYTCRRVLPDTGKICAAYLSDKDGDFCPPCVEADRIARQKFAAPVAAFSPVESSPVVVRRIWP